MNNGAPWGILVLIAGVVAHRMLRSGNANVRAAGRGGMAAIVLLGAAIIALFAYWAARAPA